MEVALGLLAKDEALGLEGYDLSAKGLAMACHCPRYSVIFFCKNEKGFTSEPTTGMSEYFCPF